MTDHNNNKGGYGRIAVEQAIWYSSNIGVAKTILKGYEDNPMKYWEGLRRIGLMEDLRLDIPDAVRARIRRPDDENNPWSKTTLPWMSFGYETMIPPIYTLAFYNAIANDGRMVRPFFVKELMRDGKTVELFQPEVIRESICSERTLAIVRDMLLGVVEKGTGKDAHSDVVRIAGKTGTAQIASGGVYRRAGHQVAFCGYFPADAPKYSCIVLIRQPRIGYPSGGRMAGGVLKAIAEKIYATRTAVDVRSIERDSTAVMEPRVKGGDMRDVEDASLRAGLVPRVVGMGAKDAVYLMERAGLRVSLSGAGRVVRQSILPGQRVRAGQSVVLTLK